MQPGENLQQAISDATGTKPVGQFVTIYAPCFRDNKGTVKLLAITGQWLTVEDSQGLAIINLSRVDAIRPVPLPEIDPMFMEADQ